MEQPQPVMTAEELQAYLGEVFPQLSAGRERPVFQVETIAPGECVLILHATEEHLRPGGTVSGPSLFTLADVGAYACALGHVGKAALAVTTNLNINFMRKAAPGEVRARVRLLKLGRKLAVFDIEMTAANAIVAHATATYSIPDFRDE